MSWQYLPFCIYSYVHFWRGNPVELIYGFYSLQPLEINGFRWLLLCRRMMWKSLFLTTLFWSELRPWQREKSSWVRCWPDLDHKNWKELVCVYGCVDMHAHAYMCAGAQDYTLNNWTVKQTDEWATINLKHVYQLILKFCSLNSFL